MLAISYMIEDGCYGVWPAHTVPSGTVSQELKARTPLESKSGGLMQVGVHLVLGQDLTGLPLVPLATKTTAL